MADYRKGLHTTVSKDDVERVEREPLRKLTARFSKVRKKIVQLGYANGQLLFASRHNLLIIGLDRKSFVYDLQVVHKADNRCELPYAQREYSRDGCNTPRRVGLSRRSAFLRSRFEQTSPQRSSNPSCEVHTPQCEQR